jgi:hypothetical protein
MKNIYKDYIGEVAVSDNGSQNSEITTDRFLISVNLAESYKNNIQFDVTVNGTSKEHMISLLQDAIEKIKNLDESTLSVN